MFNPNAATDPAVHESATRTARRCRHVVQAVLREEEWGEADWQFYLIIREELERFVGARNTTRAQA